MKVWKHFVKVITHFVSLIMSSSLAVSGKFDNITVHAAIYFCFATLSRFSFALIFPGIKRKTNLILMLTFKHTVKLV